MPDARSASVHASSLNITSGCGTSICWHFPSSPFNFGTSDLDLNMPRRHVFGVLQDSLSSG